MKKPYLIHRLLNGACLLTAVALLGHRAGAQSYSSDFENPPYTSGLINGQDSWVSAGTNSHVWTAAEITTDLTAGGLIPGTPVHSGSQALLVSGGGASQNTTRTIGGISAYSLVSVELWARPLFARTDAASLGNIFFTLEDAAGTRAAAFRFGYDSASTNTHIDCADGAVGSVIWNSTGIHWDPTNTWYQIKFLVDYGSQTYDFFLNGTQVNASPIAFYANNNVSTLSQIRVFRGTSQAGLIMDDLTITSVAASNPPTRLAAVTPYGFRFRILDLGTSTPDTNSLALTLDGVTITPTSIVQVGNIGAGDGTGLTTVYYDSPTAILATGSRHTNTIHFTGADFAPVDHTFAFTVAPVIGSLDRVHHYSGRFQGTPLPNYSGFSGGRTGAGGDFALDMGNPPGTSAKFFADDVDLLNALDACTHNDVLTCAAWIKRRSLASSSIFWINSPNAPVSGRAFQLHCPYSDNTIYFDTGGGTVPTSRLQTNILSYLGGITYWSNWHHIVAIKNGGAKQIWIDGQLLSEQTSGAASIAGYNDLNRVVLGAASPDSLVMNGVLDDFVAYSSALSSNEVVALYNGTAPTAIDSGTNLVVWWDFNDAAGLAVSKSGSDPVVNFTQILQSSTNVGGPYADVPGAANPYTNTAAPQKFFRTRKP